MKKSFESIFVKNTETKDKGTVINDFEIIEDKDKLDSVRNKIIEDIIDNRIPIDMNLNDYINKEIDKYLSGISLSTVKRNHIFNLIENEINGLGPITELLKDPNVTEIMVNAPDEVYVEIDGKIIKDESVSFINNEHIKRTIEKIVQPLGRTIDSTNPMVDARLKDGSRINAVIEPLSLKGPVLTIRKFKKDLNNIESILRNGTLTRDMAVFLEACVKSKQNIIVCGGTGSGKTTILNILSSFIGEDERIITIEDAAELSLKQRHVISLETRVDTYKSKSEITIRDLVRNSLRMRPDRIIVGEVRGKEAFDMLQAMNTGHEGSLTTLHANSPIDSLNRLETMVLMSGMEIPVSAIRDYIENAIDVVVQIERLSDGRRKIVEISEIDGFNGDDINIVPIFKFIQKGLTQDMQVDGEFKLINKKIKTLEKIKNKGFDLDFLEDNHAK
ncbi:MAG: CpaF family protein [Bacilli bacterium]|nr:CpaF family protein [Bacilli bacterium]